MSTPIVVTGLGAITPVGHNVPAMWDALLAGQSGIGHISRFDASALSTQIAAEVKAFEPGQHFARKEARRLDRFIQFAIIAAREATADAGLALEQVSAERAGVFIGSGFGGMATLHEQMGVLQQNGQQRVSPFLIPMMIPNMAAGKVAITLGLKGPTMSTMTACAASADAIGQAAEAIRRGDAEVMLCGGSEAPLTPLIMAGFGALGALAVGNGKPEQACRPFDAQREGCVIGEGAAIMVLESLEHAQRRGARIYAELAGYGATADAVHITSPAENGEGIARAMGIALDKAGLSPAEVDYLNAHGTGTVLNDRSETAGIKAVFGEHAYRLPVSSTKSTMGHLIGAAGASEAIACVKALQTQTIPPTINYEQPDPACDLDYVPNQARRTRLNVALTNSIGFGGHNATLAFRSWN